MAKLISTNGSISTGMQVGAAVGQALNDVGTDPGMLQATYENVVKNGGVATITGPNGTAQVICEPQDMGNMFSGSSGMAAPSTPSEQKWAVVQMAVIVSWFVVPLAAKALFNIEIVVFWTFICAYILISYKLRMNKEE